MIMLFPDIQMTPRVPIKPKPLINFAAYTGKDRFEKRHQTNQIQFGNVSIGTTTPHNPALEQFKSSTTRIIEAETEKPNPNKLAELIKASGDSRLGVPTLDFLQSKPNNVSSDEVSSVYNAFQEITVNLRSDENSRKKTASFYTGTINGKPYEIEYINKGEIGYLYRLNINDHNYALKIYKKSGHSGEYARPNHGPYVESVNGLFFTAKPTKDLTYLYFSDPEVGYSVYEWRDKHNKDYETRPGKTLWEQGYVCTDDLKSEEEYKIADVICDHGSIDKITDYTFQERQKFEVPNYPGFTASVKQYPNYEKEKLLTIYQVLMEKAPLHQASLVSYLDYLPEKDRLEAIKIAIQASSNARAEVIPRIQRELSNPNDRKTAYQLALDYFNLHPDDTSGKHVLGIPFKDYLEKKLKSS